MAFEKIDTPPLRLVRDNMVSAREDERYAPMTKDEILDLFANLGKDENAFVAMRSMMNSALKNLDSSYFDVVVELNEAVTDVGQIYQDQCADDSFNTFEFNEKVKQCYAVYLAMHQKYGVEMRKNTDADNQPVIYFGGYNPQTNFEVTPHINAQALRQALELTGMKAIDLAEILYEKGVLRTKKSAESTLSQFINGKRNSIPGKSLIRDVFFHQGIQFILNHETQDFGLRFDRNKTVFDKSESMSHKLEQATDGSHILDVPCRHIFGLSKNGGVAKAILIQMMDKLGHESDVEGESTLA